VRDERLVLVEDGKAGVWPVSNVWRRGCGSMMVGVEASNGGETGFW